ncbi:MAG: helix-turn-helix domain-containing protein [Treponema sp.]
MRLGHHLNGLHLFFRARRAAFFTAFALCLLFFTVRTALRARQNGCLERASFLLSYRLGAIESYSFQALAAPSFNRLLSSYAESAERYQINEWNAPFSEYLESLAGSDDFIGDAFFFPVSGGKKSALTMRENLSFSTKSVLRSQDYIARIIASNGNPVWFGTEKGAFVVRLIKNLEDGRAIGALCFAVNMPNIERFLRDGKCRCKLLFSSNDGKRVCPVGAGKTNRAKFAEKTLRENQDSPLFLVLTLSPAETVFCSLPALFLVPALSFALPFFAFQYKRKKCNFKQKSPPLESLFFLSPLEVKICRLIADGRTNKEIAWELELKEQTIKNYTHKIYKKLGTTGRVAAGILLNNFFQKTQSTV